MADRKWSPPETQTPACSGRGLTLLLRLPPLPLRAEENDLSGGGGGAALLRLPSPALPLHTHTHTQTRTRTHTLASLLYVSQIKVCSSVGRCSSVAGDKFNIPGREISRLSDSVRMRGVGWVGLAGGVCVGGAGGHPPPPPPQNNTNTTLLAQKGHEMVIGTFVRKTDYGDCVRAGGAIRCHFPLQAIFFFFRRWWRKWPEIGSSGSSPLLHSRLNAAATALQPFPRVCSRPKPPPHKN